MEYDVIDWHDVFTSEVVYDTHSPRTYISVENINNIDS